jgi:hypothetical protein
MFTKTMKSFAELKRAAAESAEALVVAQAAHEAKMAADTMSEKTLAQARQRHTDATADLAKAQAEEKRQEFARTLDPLIEALGGSRKTVAAANERALAAALP